MKSNWLIPVAIILVGVFIAIAVYDINHKHQLATQGNPLAMRPIGPDDHVLGNPAAPVVIVEYADIDSSYTKQYQGVLEQAIKDYGDEGNVAWVFRHFPLPDQDPYSEDHAEAAECAAAQDGTRGFFAFIDALQAAAPGDSEFNPADYPSLVTTLKLSQSDFDTCIKAKTYQKKIASDYQNALATGASGSPYSIVLVRGQAPVVVSGFVPYSTLKKIIDKSISQALQSS